MAKLRIYLAGAIRDDYPEDIEWRETFIKALGDQAIILNPLAGKLYNPETRKWTIYGFPSSGDFIVHHDFWMIRNSDLIVFNLLALAEGYPNIGTLIEFGYAISQGRLIYSIIQKDYQGHESVNQFKLHPFLEKNSSMIFQEENECLRFLVSRIKSLGGDNPTFGGIIP